MFTFSKPRYQSKRVHPVTQKTEPSYLFDVRYHDGMEDAPLAIFLDAEGVLTAQHLEEGVREVEEWWVSFLQSFLAASTAYFSRPYTAQHLQRILRHLLVPTSSGVTSASASASASTPVPYPQRVCCVPAVLELIGGQLLVHWKYESYPARIDIPEEPNTSPVPVPAPAPALALAPAPPDSTEIEEWDANAVPEEHTTEPLENPAMLLEKQRVKEARLRAKLAVYRAQYQMNRFQDKYGQEVSDSESDETDEDEEEDEDDQDSIS